MGKSRDNGASLLPNASARYLLNRIIMTIMLAAIGYSLIYLLLGGGFGGAVLIFIVAKMFGK
jgi:hypothetical protein